MTGIERTENIRKLFRRGQTLTFQKGAVIVGNNTSPKGVYYITGGYLKVYSISDAGDEYLHIILGKGEIFPMTYAYLGRNPESLYFEAISECALQRISKDWFNWFLHADNELSFAMGQQLALQFQAYSDRLDNLEYKKASERIAYRLLFLAARFGREVDAGIMIEAPVTHDTFAHSINLARETVSRELERLERDKVIGRIKNHFVIKDGVKLSTKLSRPPDFIYGDFKTKDD